MEATATKIQKNIQISGKVGKSQNLDHTPDLDQQNAVCKIAAKQCLLSLMNIFNLDTWWQLITLDDA